MEIKKIVNYMFLISLTLCFALLLSGCFETGKNKGSNKVLLNGSVLKGTVTQAIVYIYDAQGNLMWEGISDEKGEFIADILTNSDQVFTIVVKVADGAMQCDATECTAPKSSKVYQFGEFMPGDELGDIEFKSAVFVGDESYSSDKPSDNSSEIISKSIQITSLSTLVVDMVESQLDKGLSGEQFRAIAQSSSAILIATLGLAVGETETINVLDITLPNIVQQYSINNAEPLIASLGLINASQADDISRLEQFSEALVQYSSSTGEYSSITALEEIQHTILQETNSLITSDLVQIDSEEIKSNMTQALSNGVNFTELSAAIDEFAVNTGKVHDKISASSTYWGANHNPIEGQWWWVSGADSQSIAQSDLQPNVQKSEWIQLNYNSAFLARQIKIGLDNQFQSEQAIIQGSNDETNWIELVDLNSLNNIEQYVDERNVRHISIELNHGEIYKKYRFYSELTDSIWLEYLCVYQSYPTPEPTKDQVCENSRTPNKTITYNSMLAPGNIDNADPKSWWVSELGSGNEEWLQVSYQLPFVADRVEIVVKKSNQGKAVSLQGSLDGKNWTVIKYLSLNEYSNKLIDEQGFRHLEVILNDQKAFQYYRYHSKPTSFVWLQYLRLFEK